MLKIYHPNFATIFFKKSWNVGHCARGPVLTWVHPRGARAALGSSVAAGGGGIATRSAGNAAWGGRVATWGGRVAALGGGIAARGGSCAARGGGGGVQGGGGEGQIWTRWLGRSWAARMRHSGASRWWCAGRPLDMSCGRILHATMATWTRDDGRRNTRHIMRLYKLPL